MVRVDGRGRRPRLLRGRRRRACRVGSDEAFDVERSFHRRFDCGGDGGGGDDGGGTGGDGVGDRVASGDVMVQTTVTAVVL